VSSLEGEPIESFALRVAETWQLGHQGLDNGLLLVVSKGDRRARVEVGYGLEGVVPDVVAKRALEDAAFPHFRSGDYAGGIEAGVDALIRAARGEVVPVERRPARRGAPHEDPMAAVAFGGFLALMLALPFRRRRPRVRPGPVVVGALVSGVVAALMLQERPWTGLGALVGALAGALGQVLPRDMGGSWQPGGGWSGGGFGRGGGFGGGGGFSGGGGGFGGGGASGSW
jgi:uncharacterized protein